MSTPTDPPETGAVDYEVAKAQACSPDQQVRRRLAARTDVQPEILYYLATDAVPEVRREIANNASTPRHADLVLAHDEDERVRGDLAAKIARLVPEIPDDALDHIERMTLDILETLARDQAVTVRQVVAETLRDVAGAPASVVNGLARDVELRVAEPILRHSPVLGDEDLMEIIADSPAAGVLKAVAQRATIGSSLADAIVASDDDDAVTALLSNPSAQIREETLDRIIEQAPRHEPWHAPLVRHPRLPRGAAARLARFVAEALLDTLLARKDLDPDTAREVAGIVHDRLAGRAGPFRPSAPTLPADQDQDKAAARRRGGARPPDERQIASALGRGDHDTVVDALSELSGLSWHAVRRIIESRSPRGVTALAWRAGLSMEAARQIQLHLAHIPPNKALGPCKDGDYPLTVDDMNWQIEIFSM